MGIQSVLGLKAAGNGRAQASSDELVQKIDKAVNHLLDLPKRVGYGSERVKITPELAQHYLTFNRNNWDVIAARVNSYADEMARGEWKENGEGIKFSKNARLIDGQHRLMAILKSGVTIFMWVFYGIEEDAQNTIDTGRTKTARGVMTVQGLATWEARTLGTAIHPLFNHSLGLPLCSNVKRLNREVENFYLENRERLHASIKLIGELPRRNPPLSHATTLALHFCFAAKDVERADEFVSKLFTGESIARSSPIYQLRERLHGAQLADAKPLSQRAKIHAAIKAWNYCRQGKGITSARSLLPRSDEPLPEIE